MVKLKSFKELIVWQKAYKLVLEVYKVTKTFPSFEIYALAQQMRKAAVSIPSNMAEGYNRKTKLQYHQFLSMAYGSLSELETQYLLSIDLGYTGKCEIVEVLLKEVGSMLYCMIYRKN